MKLIYNNKEYNITNRPGLDYIKHVFTATMRARYKDDDKVDEVLTNLVAGHVPVRGKRQPLEHERTIVLRGLLESAGIDARLKSDQDKRAALSTLARRLNKDVCAMRQEIDIRAEQVKELSTV
jgi:hypothetical protein